MSDVSFYDDFVDNSLMCRGLCIKPISQLTMQSRLNEIMGFVNSIRVEYNKAYGWKPENKEYFLNPLNQKFKYSLLIENIQTKEICLVNFTSIYINILHTHGTYVSKNYRNQDLAKYHMLKICNMAIANGIQMQEGYWPKHNNGSIILHLKMGWRIEEIRKNGTQLYMKADNKEVRDNVYKMLSTVKK